MALHQLQLDLQRHLLRSGAADVDAGTLLKTIADVPPIPIAERIAIYKNAYRSRLIDALADTHPLLLKVLGDEDFADAATGFIDSLPSVHRSIRWYGREFADTLAQRAPFDQQPIFAELARFEWTLSEVFDAPDAPVVDREALQKIPGEKWGEMCIEFHPSLRSLSLQWNTVAVWRAMSRDESPPDPEASDEPTHWLLWRQDFKSHFRSLEADERAGLRVALCGDNFSQVCGALTPFAAQDEIPMRAATFIAGWIDSGLVTAAGVPTVDADADR